MEKICPPYSGIQNKICLQMYFMKKSLLKELLFIYTDNQKYKRNNKLGRTGLQAS